MLFPKCRLAKLHDAAGRQARFTDVPPPQLVPVVDRRRSPKGLGWDARRDLTTQKAPGETGCFNAQHPVRQEPASHDTLAELALKKNKDRRIGDLGKAF